MNTLLQLNTSLFAAHGQSSRLNEAFVANWKDTHPDGDVIARDFATSPVPHLSADASRPSSPNRKSGPRHRKKWSLIRTR